MFRKTTSALLTVLVPASLFLQACGQGITPTPVSSSTSTSATAQSVIDTACAAKGDVDTSPKDGICDKDAIGNPALACGNADCNANGVQNGDDSEGWFHNPWHVAMAVTGAAALAWTTKACFFSGDKNVFQGGGCNFTKTPGAAFDNSNDVGGSTLPEIELSNNGNSTVKLSMYLGSPSIEVASDVLANKPVKFGSVALGNILGSYILAQPTVGANYSTSTGVDFQLRASFSNDLIGKDLAVSCDYKAFREALRAELQSKGAYGAFAVVESSTKGQCIAKHIHPEALGWGPLDGANSSLTNASKLLFPVVGRTAPAQITFRSQDGSSEIRPYVAKEALRGTSNGVSDVQLPYSPVENKESYPYWVPNITGPAANVDSAIQDLFLNGGAGHTPSLDGAFAEFQIQ